MLHEKEEKEGWQRKYKRGTETPFRNNKSSKCNLPRKGDYIFLLKLLNQDKNTQKNKIET